MLKEGGLSEGQWPLLTTEGPVINVQRQSRTLQLVKKTTTKEAKKTTLIQWPYHSTTGGKTPLQKVPLDVCADVCT